MSPTLKSTLWLLSATLLGAALPSILLGKTVMYVLIIVGLIVGFVATRGESLRASMRLMLNSWQVLLVVAFLVWALVGSFLGINPVFAMHKWSQLLILAVLSGALFVTLREMPGVAVERLLTTLAVGVAAVATLGLIDALWGNPTFSWLLHGAEKATTPYRLNFLSGALAVTLPFVWCWVWLKAREGVTWAQRFGLILAALSVITVIIAGGRAGWVGMAAGLTFFLIGMGRHHGFVLHARHWRLAIGTGALGLAGYALSHGLSFFTERLTIVSEGGRGPMSGRLDVWQKAIDHLFDSPIWGIGVQNFRHLPAGTGIDAHPHNWLLQLILETGFVGLALFVALIGMAVYTFYGYAKNNPWGVAALASLGAFLVTGLANTSLFNLWWSTYLVMVLMLGWRVAWSHASTTSQRSRIVPRRDLLTNYPVKPSATKKPKKRR